MTGEVWFCSGQSNMAITMAGYKNQPILYSEEIIKMSKNNQIRVFTADRKTSDIPLSEVGGSWSEAEPDVIASTSALAYQFAQKLQEKLQVPVGISIRGVLWYQGGKRSVMP